MDRGEIAFALFDYDEESWAAVSAINNSFARLEKIQALFGEKALPQYLITYVRQATQGRDSLIGVHTPTDMTGYRDADKERIERRKGFFGKSQREKFPEALHHFAVFHNGAGKARLIYKFSDGNISFIKNLKHVR